MCGITTWADGYGIWHARVPLAVGSLSIRKNKAHKAIALELSAREAPGWNPATLNVKRVSEDETGSVYVEVWP